MWLVLFHLFYVNVIKIVPSLCKNPDLQFQCDDATTCIAVYDICNGITECPDGSDETLCEKDSSLKFREIKNPKSVTIRTIGSRAAAENRLENERTLFPIHVKKHALSEADGNSARPDFSKKLLFSQGISTLKQHNIDNGHYYPKYYASSDADEADLELPELRRKTVISGDRLSTLMSHSKPSGTHLTISRHLLDEELSPNEDTNLVYHRKLFGHSPSRSPYAVLSENDDSVESNNEIDQFENRRNRGRKHNYHRSKIKPLVEQSSGKILFILN